MRPRTFSADRPWDRSRPEAREAEGLIGSQAAYDAHIHRVFDDVSVFADDLAIDGVPLPDLRSGIAPVRVMGLHGASPVAVG